MSGKKKYKEVITGKMVVSDISTILDISNDADNLLLKAREYNDSAYHDLILTNQNKVAFNIIDKVVTKELPDGDAGLAWRKLSAKYDSKSSVKVVELSNEFNKSRLTSLKTDPEEWIVELKILQARLDDMNFPITEKHLLIHVIHNLPEQ